MERLLAGLTEQQRLAVTTASPRLRILAGAGSGKTRVLTRRIAHGAHGNTLEADHTMALTFTRRAAGELRERLRKLGLTDDVAAGTFHAQAYAQLRARWAENDARPPELLPQRGRLLFPILGREMARGDKLAVLAEVDWARARRIEPETYPAAAARSGRELPVPAERVAEAFATYETRKRNQRLVDFDDLLELVVREMSDPTYARAQHWRVRHLFVDEFQDVNPLQFALLQAWLGPESTLCVVGDPNQAIYAWNGADATYLQDFASFFAGAETVELTHNFRSTPQILRAAAAVLGSAPMDAHRPDGPPPRVYACNDEVHEARVLARRVRDRHGPGQRWGRQAVLVRTNAQTTVIADAFHSAGIPVAIKKGSGLLDDPTISERTNELGATSIPLTTALTDLRLDAAEADDDATRDALESLAGLAADQLAVQPDATSTDFVSWLRTIAGDDQRPGQDAVDIVTFHASKGLEWPIVHIAGVEDGLVPIGRALTDSARAEEVRLFYVAVTRAEDELHCSWAASRRFGERSMDRSPSPFLERLSVTELADPPGTSNIEHVRALRATLGVSDPDDDVIDLRDHIRTWRLNAARAAGVPAYVVFSDRTLDALVSLRPTDRDQLSAIPGLGPIKIARYGDDLLQLVSDSDS